MPRPIYVGVYWTRPVPWAGFVTLSPDPATAAGQSRTIRYQREIIRRFVRDADGILDHEVALMELAPDRATPESMAELEKTVASVSPAAIFLSVEFSETRGWRPHPFLRKGLPPDRTLALPPEPLLIDGALFDPISHFRQWRAQEKAHIGNKAQHRARVIEALRPVIDESYPNKAVFLNKAGIGTNGGRHWTADNLRKFLAPE